MLISDDVTQWLPPGDVGRMTYPELISNSHASDNLSNRRNHWVGGLQVGTTNRIHRLARWNWTTSNKYSNQQLKQGRCSGGDVDVVVKFRPRYRVCSSSFISKPMAPLQPRVS